MITTKEQILLDAARKALAFHVSGSKATRGKPLIDPERYVLAVALTFDEFDREQRAIKGGEFDDEMTHLLVYEIINCPTPDDYANPESLAEIIDRIRFMPEEISMGAYSACAKEIAFAHE